MILAHLPSSNAIKNLYLKIFFIISAFYFCVPTVAEGENFNEIYLSYRLTPNADLVTYNKRIDEKFKIKSGKYYVWVSNFAPQKMAYENSEWSLTSDEFSRFPKSESNQIEIPLKINPKHLNQPLKNTKWLYLNYIDQYGANGGLTTKNVPTSIVMFKVFLTSKKSNMKWVVYVPYLYQLGGESDHIDVASNTWLPKTLTYLVKRELGLPFKGNWRYAESHGRIAFKRRLNMRIDKFSAMEVVFSKNQTMKLQASIKYSGLPVSCQFRLGFKDNLRYSKKVECDNLPKSFKASEKAPSLVVSLDDLKNLPESQQGKIYLRELSIFYPGPLEKIDTTKFLKKINFYSSSLNKFKMDSKDNSFKSIFLKPRFVENSKKGKELKIRVAELIKQSAPEIQLEKVSLLFHTHGSLLKEISILGEEKRRFEPKIQNSSSLLNFGELEIPKSHSIKWDNLKSDLKYNLTILKAQNLISKKELNKLINTSKKLDYRKNSKEKGDQKPFFFKKGFYIPILIIIFVLLLNFKFRTPIFLILSEWINANTHLGLLIISGFMYILGLVFSPWGKDGFFSFGGIFLTLSWKYFTPRLYSLFEREWPQVATSLFGDSNQSYWTGFCLALILSSLLMGHSSLGVEVFSTWAFCMLIAGSYPYFLNFFRLIPPREN